MDFNIESRCARINHHGSFILFSDLSEIDGPLGLRILNGSFACQASPSCGILLHRTLRMRKNPWRSVAPTAHQKPSSRQRSKSNRSVKRPIRAHPISVFFDKSNPNGICAHLRDLWGNKKHPERFSLASLSLSLSRVAAPAGESPDGGVRGRVLS